MQRQLMSQKPSGFDRGVAPENAPSTVPPQMTRPAASRPTVQIGFAQAPRVVPH
ncbi:Hypothetical protein NGAL_HAMBI2610_42070 [Neorhizobium galegae bv. orientalis]|nr:Hypothetical protein NGAL_HAMBI2610_42070 [Neorhizobium galegae bv. orientalis]